MKLYHLIFILLFTLNGCNKGNRNLENAKNRNKSEINIIDTTNVIPQLKTLLREYIKTYPQFNNLVLDGDVVLYKENKAMNSDLIYLLGPTSMMKYGEYYVDKRLYPSSYLKIADKLVFISSSNDKLTSQEICKKIYLKHLEIENNKKINNKYFWLVKITNNGSAFVFSKNINDYMIKRVKNQIDGSSILK